MMRRRRAALDECESRTQGARVFENTGATEDAEWLFERVRVGTPVFIVRA